MKSSVTKSDLDLKTDVLAELTFEPSVNMTAIRVLVKDWVVTLNGTTETYDQRWNAVRAAQRVVGVRALADDIVVDLPQGHQRTDGDLAAAAAHHLEWSTLVPPGTVSVTVAKGLITLAGEVEWWYQKNAAENASQHITRVKRVNNRITILPKQTPSEVAKTIQSAFERTALIDANRIKVEILGNKVILRGTVRHNLEREEAERIAWAAAGVLSVENHLTVAWSWAFAE